MLYFQSLVPFCVLVQNRLIPLLKLTIPCVLSVSVCPMLLAWSQPFKDEFWPNGLDDMININDALGVFLVPASLLYALLFTVSFQIVMEKQTQIRMILNKEVQSIFQNGAYKQNK